MKGKQNTEFSPNFVEFGSFVFKYLDRRYVVKGNVVISPDNSPKDHVIGVFGDDAEDYFRLWCQTIHEKVYIEYTTPLDWWEEEDRDYPHQRNEWDNDEDDYDTEEDLRDKYGFQD